MVDSENMAKIQQKRILKLKSDLDKAQSLLERFGKLNDISQQEHQKKSQVAELKSKISEVSSELKEVQARSKRNERKVQERHEFMVDYQERQRKMLEVIRLKRARDREEAQLYSEDYSHNLDVRSQFPPRNKRTLDDSHFD